MCGIAGVIGRVGGVHNLLARTLSLMNVSRGRDSYGYLTHSIRKDVDEPWIFQKSIFSAETYLRNMDKDDVEFTESDVTMIHCRGASKVYGIGSASFQENAHPFSIGNVVGAHNGCIRNWYDLKQKYKMKRDDGSDLEVDSEVIFWLLSNEGTKALAELEGQAAIWWWDCREPDKVFIRNWDKDLAIHESKGLVVFTSDHAHLHLLGMQSRIIPSGGEIFSIDTKSREIVQTETVKGKEYSYTEGTIFSRVPKMQRWCVSVKYGRVHGWKIYSPEGRYIFAVEGRKLPKDYANLDHRGCVQSKIEELQRISGLNPEEEEARAQISMKYTFEKLDSDETRTETDDRTMLDNVQSSITGDIIEHILDGNEVLWCPVCKDWIEKAGAVVWEKYNGHEDVHVCPDCGTGKLVKADLSLCEWACKVWLRIRPTDRQGLMQLYGLKSDAEVLEQIRAQLEPTEAVVDDDTEESFLKQRALALTHGERMEPTQEHEQVGDEDMYAAGWHGV